MDCDEIWMKTVLSYRFFLTSRNTRKREIYKKNASSTLTRTWPSEALKDDLSSGRSKLGSSISIIYSILSLGNDIVTRFNRSDERAARMVWQVCCMYAPTPAMRQCQESKFLRNTTSGYTCYFFKKNSNKIQVDNEFPKISWAWYICKLKPAIKQFKEHFLKL